MRDASPFIDEGEGFGRHVSSSGLQIASWMLPSCKIPVRQAVVQLFKERRPVPFVGPTVRGTLQPMFLRRGLHPTPRICVLKLRPTPGVYAQPPGSASSNRGLRLTLRVYAPRGLRPTPGIGWDGDVRPLTVSCMARGSGVGHDGDTRPSDWFNDLEQAPASYVVGPPLPLPGSAHDGPVEYCLCGQLASAQPNSPSASSLPLSLTGGPHLSSLSSPQSLAPEPNPDAPRCLSHLGAYGRPIRGASASLSNSRTPSSCRPNPSRGAPLCRRHRHRAAGLDLRLHRLSVAKNLLQSFPLYPSSLALSHARGLAVAMEPPLPVAGPDSRPNLNKNSSNRIPISLASSRSLNSSKPCTLDRFRAFSGEALPSPASRSVKEASAARCRSNGPE
nr:unnamed protein product [Digitaria exilis]